MINSELAVLELKKKNYEQTIAYNSNKGRFEYLKSNCLGEDREAILNGIEKSKNKYRTGGYQKMYSIDFEKLFEEIETLLDKNETMRVKIKKIQQQERKKQDDINNCKEKEREKYKVRNEIIKDDLDDMFKSLGGKEEACIAYVNSLLKFDPDGTVIYNNDGLKQALDTNEIILEKPKKADKKNLDETENDGLICFDEYTEECKKICKKYKTKITEFLGSEDEYNKFVNYFEEQPAVIEFKKQQEEQKKKKEEEKISKKVHEAKTKKDVKVKPQNIDKKNVDINNKGINGKGKNLNNNIKNKFKMK